MDSGEAFRRSSGPSDSASSGLLRPGVRTLLPAVSVALVTVGLEFLNQPKAWSSVALAAFVLAMLATGHAFEKGVLLTLAMACLLAHEMGRRVIKTEEAMPLIVAFLFLASRANLRSGFPHATWTERWILILLSAALVGAVRGLVAGNPAANVLDEFALFLDFALAILIIRRGISDRWSRCLVWILVGCTVLVSTNYLRVFVIGGGHTRAVSDQQHLLNIAIPVLFALLILADNARQKLVAAALLVPMIPATYVTQTRALWLYIPLSLVLLTVLLTVHRYIRARSLATLAVGVGLVLAAILGYTALTRGAESGHRAIAVRAESLKNLSSDLSLAERIDLAFQAYSRVSRQPLLGTGLGDHLRYRIIQVNEPLYFMDFSYMWVLWKMGIMGLIPLLGLYFVFLKRTWFVYRHTTDQFQRAAASGIFVAFIGLMITGFESGILIIYRFNLVWAVLMGLMECWARQVKPASSPPVTP
jgi:hypothetical protein